jgi:hypothetical protein
LVTLNNITKISQVTPEVTLFLRGLGFSNYYIIKIFNLVGEAAIALTEDNPYWLLDEFSHMGFKKIDEAAEKLVGMALSGCRFYELVHEAGDYVRDRDKAWMLLDSMERKYRDLAVCGSDKLRTYKTEDICNYVDHIEEARLRLKRKMSAEYAMKELLLAITG